MDNNTNIGLQIVEGVASGAVAFQEPSKRNIGIAGEFERGVPGKVYRIGSLDDAEKYLGVPISSAFGGYIIRQLFKHAAPAPVLLFATRIIGATSVAATAAINWNGITGTVTAAYRGDSDPGTWGNQLSFNLWSYDYARKNLYLWETLYKGVVRESFTGATLAALQETINKNSNYAKVSFSGEPAVAYTNLTGTSITTTTTSPSVTGVGTTFTTQLEPGSLLFTSAGVYIGKVKSITSDTALTLMGNAFVAGTLNGTKKRTDSKITGQALAGGTYVDPVEADFYPVPDPVAAGGIAIFDKTQIQLLIVTENHTLTLAQKMKEYCTTRQDCIAIVNLPMNADEQIIELYSNTLSTATRNFIAGYMDWDNVYNENGDQISIPSLGRVLGAGFLRTPFLQGDGVHIPPGGIDSYAVDVISVVSGDLSQSQINKYVRDYNVNVSMAHESYGRFLLSSRMFCTNELYQSIHTNMQTNFYRRLLFDNLLFLLQKLSQPDYKKQAATRITSYFEQEYEKGALERSIKFEEAFKVIADLSNNPLSQDRRITNIDLELILAEVTEAVKISINRADKNLTVKVQ